MCPFLCDDTPELLSEGDRTHSTACLVTATVWPCSLGKLGLLILWAGVNAHLLREDTPSTRSAVGPPCCFWPLGLWTRSKHSSHASYAMTVHLVVASPVSLYYSLTGFHLVFTTALGGIHFCASSLQRQQVGCSGTDWACGGGEVEIAEGKKAMFMGRFW